VRRLSWSCRKPEVKKAKNKPYNDILLSPHISAFCCIFVASFSQLDDIVNENIPNVSFSHIVALCNVLEFKTIVANIQGFTKHQKNEVFAGDWAQEIRSTIGLFQLQFQTVHLHVNIPETMSIHANFGELNQVLLNLMVNAVQAGADTLRIEAEYSPKQAVMRVADNGKGMTDTTRERIFEPFFSTKGVGNSGLGLSISRHIIERHGGKLWVESEVGKGTTFIVELRSGLA
jgi:signal transduction histidine kinase